MTWQAELEILRRAGVAIDPGLTGAELRRAESVVGAEFPADLRALLSEGLPVGSRFPNWREADSEQIRKQLDWPLEGIEFDVEMNAFWFDDCGPRPEALADALVVTRMKIAEAPRLIPVYGHRYIPAEPATAGNPIFSVHQTDIILYGDDLAGYLRHEFERVPYADAVHHGSVREIRFWSDLAG